MAATTKCKCVEAVNKELKADGCKLDGSMFIDLETGKGGIESPLLRVVKIDSGNRKAKIPKILCSYCPFCGRKK